MITDSLRSLEKMKAELSYCNVFEIFLDHGDHVAMEYKLDGEVKEITFAETEHPVRYVADQLTKRLEGCGKGFVALKLDNCPEWPILFWGIMMAGFKPFLVDYRHNEQLTQFFLKQVAAVAMLSAKCEETGGDTISIAVDEILVCDKQKFYEIAKGERPQGTCRERIRSYPWADEIALCTSGTTSTAKVYTYNGRAMGNQILSATQIIKENERILSDRKIKNLAFLPFHHIFGFLACYLWYSFFRSTLVFPEGKAPSALLAACREHQVTHMMAVPLLVNNIVAGIKRKLAKESKVKQLGFQLMCNISLFAQRISPEGGIRLAKRMFKRSVLDNLVGTSLDVIICGGGHVLPDSLRVINAIGYYTICGFGMTEVGVSSVDLDYRIQRRLSGCVGVPVESIEYRIVSNDPEKPNIGELQMRGASIHSGRMVDGVKVPPNIDENGWFATGDIGRMEKGALYIEGRLKEVIINESGENVYPDELEDHFTALAGVNQFSIVGIAKEQAGIYEDITLVLESANDVTDSDYTNQLLNEIYSRNNALPVFKKVSRVLITNKPLPLSNGIKVKRGEIKKQIETKGQSDYIKLK